MDPYVRAFKLCRYGVYVLDTRDRAIGPAPYGFIPTMLFVAAIAVLSGLPGALMIFSPVTLFKAHGNAALAWGLTPLEDQQIAGLIMWVPAGIFFLVPIAWLFVKSLQACRAAPCGGHSIILFAVCLTPIDVAFTRKGRDGRCFGARQSADRTNMVAGCVTRFLVSIMQQDASGRRSQASPIGFSSPAGYKITSTT